MITAPNLSPEGTRDAVRFEIDGAGVGGWHSWSWPVRWRLSSNCSCLAALAERGSNKNNGANIRLTSVDSVPYVRRMSLVADVGQRIHRKGYEQ
jgi:hypothetical protein